MKRLAWTAVALLALLGVIASVGRAMFVDDLGTRAQPIRNRLFAAAGAIDPDPSLRSAEVARLDRTFANHRLATYVHVAGGAAFLLFGMLQLSRRVRARSLRFHRVSGRVLVSLALLATLSGLFFGVFDPFGGPPETVVIVIVAIAMTLSLTRGVMAARRGDIARHREWMIRGYAIALGVSTVRVVVGIADFTLSPMGFTAAPLFVASLWIGWALTSGAAEWWIRRTRTAAESPVRATVAA